ncbi:hypothetical protein EVAR_38591_1 [Eumeta japonica]|uniref:Uncharacterized protein n=1 Tax=Eumeta variegata TaxID=151549 RepID=A0A4C1WTG5_EUMVA|nr:hypothetical protein EVAR_38591_1 [Eumeta japonica]
MPTPAVRALTDRKNGRHLLDGTRRRSAGGSVRSRVYDDYSRHGKITCRKSVEHRPESESRVNIAYNILVACDPGGERVRRPEAVPSFLSKLPEPAAGNRKEASRSTGRNKDPPLRPRIIFDTVNPIA